MICGVATLLSGGELHSSLLKEQVLNVSKWEEYLVEGMLVKLDTRQQ